MGCDIHICIQAQGADGVWSEVAWQEAPYGRQSVLPGIPVAPDVFRNRNYHLFAILADVRNGTGFAGIKTGEGWPSIAADRGFPDGFDPEGLKPNPRYPDDGPYWMGDHSFTWVSLDELKSFGWDVPSTRLFGVVPSEVYEELCAQGIQRPKVYSGAVTGLGIKTYEPDEYAKAREACALSQRPYVRMAWTTTAREATGDWPGQVIPWLESLAAGRPLRLVLGFDS